MVRCLMVDRLIAISSVNCQLLLDGIEKARNCRKGNLPGLFFDSLLQCWDRGCLPSNFVNSLFQHGDGALRHLPTCCFKIVFLEADYAVNCHKYIKFFCTAIIPLSISIMAVGVIGYGWTWQVPTTPMHADFPPATRLHPQASSPRRQTHLALPFSGR